jgi:hypothetical protein
MREMDAARLAGIMAAKKAQIANPLAATRRANGYQPCASGLPFLILGESGSVTEKL